MQQLTVVGRNRVEWRDVPVPMLRTPDDVLVRPFAAARCDIDLGLIRGTAAAGFLWGKWLRQLDPHVAHVFGDAPFRAPFPLGHECVAEVLSCGENVRGFRRGDRVVVPFQISCGSCLSCASDLTAHCTAVPAFSMYGGVGGKNDGWGGALSDCVRVPWGDAMLVRVPDGVDAAAVASASDNLADGWRTVASGLAAKPGARVLVVGGVVKSIGLYAAAIAVALGSERVVYLDRNPERLRIAATLGAIAVEGSYRRRDAGDETFPVVVDATNDARGLDFALRAAAPGGVCTSVGIFPRKTTGIPLLRMYSQGLTLRNAVSNARPMIPAILELVRSGRLKPELVTTTRAEWRDAALAFTENSTKVVVTRDTIC
ncbi:MAG: alcohol dehydrogenase catalytic domain-containing protein [Steroidobacteraceae bacterium]|nr:alcohol dehydrogenase catalytic domain-containing protein [Steroidobacteraceae bacterium]